MKRRIILLIVSGLLLPVLFALGSCSVSAPNGDKPMVVTTIFPPYDFAKVVAGDRIDLSVLVTVTDSHSFSPSAADMAKIEECDLFIYTGGDGDRWAEDFLMQIDTSDKIVINMMDVCTLIESDHDHDHDHDHGHIHSHDHDYENNELLYDEHVWLDPHNAIQIVNAIEQALVKIDSTYKDEYQTNASQYISELNKLDEAYHEIISASKNRFVVVADRFPYRYLFDAFGIEYVSAMSGCGSASDLTAIQYEHLAEELREKDLSVIICAEYSDHTIAHTVVRECGKKDIQILTLHSCHTLNLAAIREGNTYLSLMRENLEVLNTALN